MWWGCNAPTQKVYMALIVKVYVNDREIIDTHVVRIKGQPHELCTYKNECGDIFTHHYDDGAPALVIKMMEHLKGRL